MLIRVEECLWQRPFIFLNCQLAALPPAEALGVEAVSGQEHRAPKQYLAPNLVKVLSKHEANVTAA